MIEAKVEKFLRLALFASKPPHTMQLRQIHAGAGDSPLMTWSVSSDLSTYGENRLTEWSHEIVDLAQQNADGFEGVTSYYLHPLYDDKSQGSRSPVWRMRSQETMSPEQANLMGLDSEPANAKGITAQLMRHNEALARITTQSMMGMLSTQQNIIDRQSTHIERLERNHTETFLALEEAESRKHERLLESKKQDHDEERKAEVFKKVIQYLPVLASKFKPLPNSPVGLEGSAENHPLVEALFSTFDSLSSDQVEKIAQVLGTDAIPVMEVYEIYLKEKKKREARAAAAGNGSGATAH